MLALQVDRCFVCDIVGTLTGLLRYFVQEQVDYSVSLWKTKLSNTLPLTSTILRPHDPWHPPPDLPLGHTSRYQLSCSFASSVALVLCVFVEESSPQMLVIVEHEHCGLTSTRPCVCAACLPSSSVNRDMCRNAWTCVCLCRSSTS